jgi:pimeloyl-ACP methyl ester carboxylesterase
MGNELRVDRGDGISLFVRTVGLRGTELPLVCVPGLNRNGRDFDAVAARWAADRFVVRPDLRGRGHSSYDPTGDTYTLDHAVADVVAVLDALGLDRVVLLGSSMGGLVSMRLTEQHPSRVAGIALNDVGPVMEPVGFARFQRYAGHLVDNATWADAAAQVQSNSGPTEHLLDDATWLRLAREQYREVTPGVIRPDHDPRLVLGVDGIDVEHLTTNWPLFDALGGTPALVLRGEVSDLFSATTVAEMQRRKPDLVAISVARRGHCPLLDEPESVAALDDLLLRAAAHS